MRNARGSWAGVGAATSYAALLTLFAIALATAHSKARHSLEAAFNEHAKVSAALTVSLFEASAATERHSYAKRYGSAHVSGAALTALAREGKSADVMLLGSDGVPIAASAGTPLAVRNEVESRPSYVRAALAGESFSLSDVMDLGRGESVIQYAQPFTTRYGRRVLLMGFSPKLLSGFIGGYLAGTTTARGSRAFVLDGRGVPIAAAANDRHPASPRAEAGLSRAIASRGSGPIGHGRYFTMTPVRHSTWRVVVTTPQSALFASVEGLDLWVPWITFAAFACVLALVLLLGVRALRHAAAQRGRDAEFRAVVAERLGLAAITETMAEGVVVTRTADMRIVYTNPSFDAMLGYERGELEDRPVAQVKPNTRHEHLLNDVAAEVERSGSWRGEVQIERKDGSLLWCLGNVTTLEHPEHGKVWIAVHSDIGDRKRIESELERASARAIEASRSKSLFVANMSHEIRTPLNGVIGMTDLLRETSLDPMQREYVDALATSGAALLALISDVLDFSKIEAGRLELDPTDFELRPTVEEACQILAEPAHSKGLEISHWVDADIPVAVSGDRARVRQILLNLISNAVKFTEHGEVSVRVRRDGAERLRFAVSDTGVGIDSEQATRLFDAFVQADPSTTRQYGGTGLGLAISSQLVHLMGGEIGAEARAGGGSTFWFSVPLRAVAGAARLPGAHPELKGVRALIVDDNATSRTILGHYLGNWGLVCASAGQPGAALEALDAASRTGEPYALVLLDSNLPQISGAAVAHEIRKRAPVSETKIIVLSSTPLEREPFAGAEVSAFFSKPARQSELHDAIAEALLEAPCERPPDEQPLPEAVSQMRGPVVLIAEDNEINLTLARALLHKRGLQTAVARNGREAVEMARENDYAAILMDCQMPELDGYEATRQIRRGENGHHVPIIAMTAHSMSGDRERCLDAGMDDYLPKPIRTEQLEQMIRRWLPAEQAPAKPAAQPGGSRGGGGDRVIDEAAIAELKQTLTPPMRGRLLETFDAQLKTCLEGIAEAIRRGDTGERRRLAHLLKGSSATIGAARLRASCERLERTGRAGDPVVGEEQLAELRATAEEARSGLAQQLR
jgi:PAS domain S-box-containing protein